jgi:hypothetical protein
MVAGSRQIAYKVAGACLRKMRNDEGRPTGPVTCDFEHLVGKSQRAAWLASAMRGGP